MAAVASEILIITLLILANGVLAMAEMAVISARKTRLQQRAEEGDAGAYTALDLAEEPSDFLSTIQVGITLIGILAGAFGGATVARELALGLDRISVLAPYSQALSVGIVVVAITYLSLVLGELTPKRLALGHAEQIASRVARPMQRLSRILSPLVRFLGFSADVALRLLHVQPSLEPPVTEEEIKILLEEGAEAGIFEPLEEEMVEQVFRLGDRKVSALLTPRTEVVWIDMHESQEQIQHKIVSSGYSRFPVARESLDNVVGVVLTKDLLAQLLAGLPIDLKAIIRPVPYVPENMPALDVLERFKAAHTKIALVLDEYGGIEGLVTTEDILDAIVGDLPELGEMMEAEAIQRTDGSWLLDGHMPIDEFGELFGLADLSAQKVETLGGLVMARLGRIPSTGDQFEWNELHFEVMDMDGRRVDKVLVTSRKPHPPGEETRD
jgi:putative hemolysin